MTRRQDIEQRTIRFGSHEIRYGLSYGDHRDLLISVTPDLEVMVCAPRPATASEIEARMLAKAPWILRQQLRYKDMHPLPQPRRYVPGETYRYLGRQYRLRVERRTPAGVWLERPCIIVSTEDQQQDPGSVAALIEQWYRSRAEQLLPKRIRLILEAHPRLRSPGIRVQIRVMSRRWGSCSRTGVLSFNPELLKAHTACIDYVVVHELCHLKVMSHGRTFQRLISSVMPDWRERWKRLNMYDG